jgi:hypothetical protein
VPRFGGDATADWYSTALPQLTGLGIRTKVVSLLPDEGDLGVSGDAGGASPRPPAVDHPRSQRVRKAVLDAATTLMFERSPNAITVEHSIVRLP